METNNESTTQMTTATPVIFFVDANYCSHVVYFGRAEHVDGLSWQGGCPCIVTEEYAKREGHELRAACDHWIEEAKQFRALEQEDIAALHARLDYA